MLSFDIETQPLPESRLRELVPAFDALPFADPGEFDASSVKVGHMKDAEKIRQKIEEKRAEHEQLRESASVRRAAAEVAHFSEFAERAGLSAATSRVLVIGIYSLPTDKFVVFDATEAEAEPVVLEKFWSLCSQVFDQRRSAVGVNIFDFDLPYLVNRSWLLGVQVPLSLLGFRGIWPQWHDGFIDLRVRWLLGRKGNSEKSSFDFIGQAFATGGKTSRDVAGGNFWKAWATDRAAALEYLANDVRQPATWAQQMGIKK